jgi:hypothetical protein
MDESNTAAKRRGLLGRWVDGLCTVRAAIWIPALFLFVPILLLCFTLSPYSHGPRWQVSGYYLNGFVEWPLNILCILWLISIISLFIKRKYLHALGRIALLLPVLIALLLIGIFWGLTPGPVSDQPIDHVYSASRDKCFILAYQPTFQDTLYQIFSAEGSQWNPIWHLETDGMTIDYSEDGSLTSDPHVLLSGDESLLVVGRGGHLTDCIDLETGKNLVEGVGWSDPDREQQWQARTEEIKKLLAEHDVADE